MQSTAVSGAAALLFGELGSDEDDSEYVAGEGDGTGSDDGDGDSDGDSGSGASFETGDLTSGDEGTGGEGDGELRTPGAETREVLM